MIACFGLLNSAVATFVRGNPLCQSPSYTRDFDRRFPHLFVLDYVRRTSKPVARPVAEEVLPSNADQRRGARTVHASDDDADEDLGDGDGDGDDDDDDDDDGEDDEEDEDEDEDEEDEEEDAGVVNTDDEESELEFSAAGLVKAATTGASAAPARSVADSAVAVVIKRQTSREDHEPPSARARSGGVKRGRSSNRSADGDDVVAALTKKTAVDVGLGVGSGWD